MNPVVFPFKTNKLRLCVLVPPSFLHVFPYLFNRRPCSPASFPSCCVSRRLRGGQTSWWSMQKTSWPSMPSTWMPLWRSNPPRAGTASLSSSCSTTSSGQTVSLCTRPAFILLPLQVFLCLDKGTNISVTSSFFAQIICAMESSTNTFRICMLLWWLDMWIWWSPPSHSQFTRALSESPGSL